MTSASLLYRAAARVVAPILLHPCVRSVYIRRSVATGEASFPWSDLDLGLVTEAARGDEMNALRRRFLMARTLFPRLGECQIASAAELRDLATSDPYRASLDRRFAITVAGAPPRIPPVPVSTRAAARRLVYWFEGYLPRAVRGGNVRNQRKFAQEMWNALGVMEGRWSEPLKTRAEAAAVMGGPEPLGSGFAVCCRIAARAWEVLAPADPPPAIRETVALPGLTVLPMETTPWPDGSGAVVTPAVLRLLLETHNPFLWWQHGPVLRTLGFPPPSRQAWVEASLRHTGGERLRQPGFVEKGPGRHAVILAQVGRVLEILERGGDPDAAIEVLAPSFPASVRDYYRHDYDTLAETAARLRQRAVACRSEGGR